MTKIRRQFGCAFAGVALLWTSMPASGVVNDPGDFQAPAVPALGPETIQVVARPGGGADVILLNGPGSGDDVVLDGGGFPLIVALKNAVPGSEPVIGIYGRINQGGNGMQIGGGDSDFKAYVAHWGAVPMRFSVVGMTPDATILEFGILNRMNNGTVHGGVEDARFENLTIESKYNACVGGPKGHQFGLLRFYNCRFVPSPANLASGAHYGFGYKWGLRLRALGRYDIRDCTFAPVLEHSIYVDSPQGDSIFKGIVHEGSTRTAIQIVNRAFDTTNIAPFENGTQIPQPSGFGRLLIEDVTIHDLTGDGGSGITVAGFLGDVWIRDITAIDNGPFQGVITVWTDAGWNHGAYFYTGDDGGLYSARSVTLENINIDLPSSDRDHVAISGVELVRIHDFSIAGNRTAFSLDSTYGAAQLSNSLCVIDGVVTRSDALIVNGVVDFYTPRPLSQYAGWASAGKIKVGSDTLSDAQIDSTWPETLTPPGKDLAVCFAGFGTWIYDDDTGTFTNIHSADAALLAAGDFDNDGSDELAVSFTGYGTWIYDVGTGTYTNIHSADAALFAAGDFDNDGTDELAVSFTGYGTWIYDGDTGSFWNIHTADAALLVAGDFDNDGSDELAVSFTGFGTWIYDDDTGTFWNVHTADAALLVAGDFDNDGSDELAMSVTGFGTWIYDDDTGTFTNIHTADAALLAAGDFDNDGSDELAVNFTGAGTWIYDDDTGTYWRIHSADAALLVAGDFDGDGSDELAVSVTGFGTWIYDDDTGTYTNIHRADAALLAAGSF